MFSEHCAQPFTVEPVDVVYEDAQGQPLHPSPETTPLLSTRRCSAGMKDVQGLVGKALDPELVCQLCTKMQLGPATYDAANDAVSVTVPPTRSDVLHAVDVIEDVAIAYGYNNLPVRVPATLTVGGALPLNAFADRLRDEVARAGYLEVLTHGLCSRAENFGKLRRPEAPAVALANPANEEYEIVRTTLLPGLLKVLQHNRAATVKDGLRFFEVSDVVLRDEGADVGARNVRRLAASHTAMAAGFEAVHGLVDRVMLLVQVGPTEAYAGSSMRAEERMAVLKEGLQYYISPSDGAFRVRAFVCLRKVSCFGGLVVWLGLGLGFDRIRRTCIRNTRITRTRHTLATYIIDDSIENRPRLLPRALRRHPARRLAERSGGDAAEDRDLWRAPPRGPQGLRHPLPHVRAGDGPGAAAMKSGSGRQGEGV